MTASRATLLAALLVGCGTTAGTEIPAASCTLARAPVATFVRLADFAYQPSCFQVPAGVEVTFYNDDSSTVYEVATAEGASDAFDSGLLPFGAIFRHAFSTTGEVVLVSPLYGGMRATVLVTAP